MFLEDIPFLVRKTTTLAIFSCKLSLHDTSRKFCLMYMQMTAYFAMLYLSEKRFHLKQVMNLWGFKNLDLQQMPAKKNSLLFIIHSVQSHARNNSPPCFLVILTRALNLVDFLCRDQMYLCCLQPRISTNSLSEL